MKKISLKRKKAAPKASNRITNETVAEHREQILAGGRKFKYPIQYSRHKLVINAVLIAVVSLVVVMIAGWALLYPAQNTSILAYRVVRILPLPVGSVDGEPVLYSDYLLQYRASEFYLNRYGEVDAGSDDWQVQLDNIKYRSMSLAQQTAYARKIAKEHNISVSDADVDEFIDQERTTSNGRAPQETYDASIRMIYGGSVDDYRLIVKNGLLKNRAAFAIDDSAKKQAETALSELRSSGDFEKAADAANKLPDGGEVLAGKSGELDVSGKFNGLRVAEVSALKVGEMSDALKSVNDDGYYIVKITAISNDKKKISFDYVHIPLTAFDHQFDSLKKDGKIHEYIAVPENAQDASS